MHLFMYENDNGEVRFFRRVQHYLATPWELVAETDVYTEVPCRDCLGRPRGRRSSTEPESAIRITLGEVSGGR